MVDARLRRPQQLSRGRPRPDRDTRLPVFTLVVATLTLAAFLPTNRVAVSYAD